MPPNESKTKKRVFVSDLDKKMKEYQIDESIEKSPDKEKRKIFLSLFERTKKDANTDEINSVRFFHLFRFATKFDIFLMFIGTFGSLANSVTLPLMLIVFMNIFDSFTDFGKFCNVTNTTNVSLPSLSSLTTQMQEQALYLLYLGIATHVFSYIQVTFWLIASQRQTRTIRKKLFQSILKQDVGWFDVYKTGELNNRLSDDVNKIRDGIGDKCGNSLQYVSTFIVCVIIALVKGWKLTLVVLSLSPFIFIASLLFTKSTEGLTKSELTAYARAGNIAQEVFTAIRTVFAFNGSKKEHQRYVKNLDAAKFFGIKKGFLNGVLMGFLWLTIFGAYALGFWYGWSLSVNVDPITGKSDYSIGKILLVFFAILIGVFSLGNAGPFFGTAATARAAAYEAFQIIDRVPPIDASSNEGKKLENLIGNIEFQNVKFKYPSRPEVPILRGINFKVNSGVTCALVGASGCGKSTCIQLMQRFYDPIEGSIMIDDINMKDLNVNWLRGQIGVVNQEPILFGTSIAENIKFGKKDATKDEIIQAAINANAHDFIMSLPDNYETLVGERGGQLSGGQKQRIAIARALIRNPRILLLDEATSALDNESESIVQAALDKARLGRTTIIVAHRLSTIRNADVIFAFEQGEIKEMGTHESLMEKKGIYYNLVITQTKSGRKTKLEEDNNDSVEDESISSDETDQVEVNQINSNIPIQTGVKSLSNIVDTTKATDKKEEDKADKKEKKSFMDYFKKGKDEPKEPKEKAPSMRKVFYMNRPEWSYIIIGCIASVIAGGIQPGFGIVLSKAVALFSSCSYDDQKSKIQTYCIIFLVFAVASFFSYIIQNGMFAIAGEELTKRMRSKAFKAMLSQEIGWFDDLENSVGVLTTKLAVEAAAVQGATGIRLGFVLMNLSNLGVGIVIAFAFSWPITLLVLGFIPFLILGGALQTKMLAGFSSVDKKNLEETGKITNESIGNIRTVAQLNKETFFIERYNEKIDLPYKKGIQSANINGFVLGLTTSVLFYAIAAAYSLGAYLIDQKLYGMTLENIMLVFNCVLFGAQSVGQASALLPDYAKAKEAVKSMFELFDRKPLINNWASDDSNGLKLADNEFVPKIQLNQVEFTYPSRKETKILKGINLNIERGQKVALVGSSGCGKSTVTQLLERFYDPDSGTISLSNKNLKDFDLQWLRSQISIVSQEPILFDISIKDNIAYGDNSREVPLEEIIEAAKKANIHEFISNLPKGYDTNVGSKGTQLSGGQKQRIAIARALISNPKILLLDEATSALDTESEKLVQDALDKAQEGRTCIIIAHRLSTIKNCDLIFVIKNGNVHEAGTHDELIAKNGFYSKLNGQHS